MKPEPRGVGTGALRVALGIGLSRGFGFLREMALAFFFGVGPHADVFRTALRGPNLLQNLLGEQSLSASFIPVYSRFLATGRREDAGRFAGAIFGLLLATVSAIAVVGVLLAEPIVTVIAPGYLADAARIDAGQASVDRFPLAVAAVRIMFPMTALLVLSAWALGVLNSHRRFFISYMAPALWNVAIIGALFMTADRLLGTEWWRSGSALQVSDLDRLVLAACMGALVGGALQFLVQVPFLFQSLQGFRFSLSTSVEGVREAFRAFLPLLAGRGAVQISGYLDFFLASFLAAGAVGALGWAQTLYLLPISLFGMSVAAAELPELSRDSTEMDTDALKSRIRRGFEQMSFLTVPSVVCFIAFGFLVVGALFRRGRFGLADNWLVYLVLVAYSVGLIASSTSRLLNNVFYAQGETRLPARVAVQRVLLSALVGVTAMFWLDRYAVSDLFPVLESDRDLYLGALGLAVGAGVGAWFELLRLIGALRSRLEGFGLGWRRAGRLLGVALLATGPGFGCWYVTSSWLRPATAVLVLTVYGGVYAGVCRWLRLGSLGMWFKRAS